VSRRAQRDPTKGPTLARDSYSYKRYQKELAKKQKVEEKKQRKLEKKLSETAPAPGQVPGDLSVTEGEHA
jgi:hypothetical protein